MSTGRVHTLCSFDREAGTVVFSKDDNRLYNFTTEQFGGATTVEALDPDGGESEVIYARKEEEGFVFEKAMGAFNVVRYD